MPVRIIKANLTDNASTIEPFNLVDMQRQSEDIITAARREADMILANAQRDAELILERSRFDAQRIGREEGLRDAESDVTKQANEIAEQLVTDRLSTALPALQAAAASLHAERDRWLARWEKAAVQLGVAVAEKLLHRQLLARPEFASEMITAALRLAAGQEKLTIYLHPADLEVWGNRAAQIVQSLTACADATLIPDHQCLRGGCRIETRHGEIDARVETMLYRIAEELADD